MISKPKASIFYDYATNWGKSLRYNYCVQMINKFVVLYNYSDHINPIMKHIVYITVGQINSWQKGFRQIISPASQII